MGLCAKLSIVVIAIFAGLLYQAYRNISQPLPPPKLDLNEYWGPGDKAAYKEDTNIIGNRVLYPQSVIDDLRVQLNRTIEFTEPLEGVGFEYGFNTNKLKEIIAYWRDEYLPKWRSREIYLWKFPHFTTQIQGLQIHFLHVKPETRPKNKKIFPVILLHGWPGSIREFYEFIPKLIDTKNTEYTFEVVVPSLPGYGWSQGASKPGMGSAEIAIVLRNLMLRLGYNKFLVQGGDWGSVIGNCIATLFPENVIGFHSNFGGFHSKYGYLKSFIASFFPTFFVDKEFVHFHFPLANKFSLLIEESGYFHIQATKPDTIGTALLTSPAGLAAWILEKFSTGTNKDFRQLADGGLEKRFTMDSLLDNIMIYYLNNAITTSVRIYAENMTNRQRSHQIERVPSVVPAGFTRFEHDISHHLDWILRDKFPNLIHSTYHKDGGHFIAMEKPDVLYKDFIQFVDKVVEFIKKP